MQSRNRPPESGGQRDRNAIARGAGSSRKTFRNALLEVLAMGTTPALRATPRDSGGESGCPHRLERFSIASRQYESSSRLRVRSFSRQRVGIRVITSKVRNRIQTSPRAGETVLKLKPAERHSRFTGRISNPPLVNSISIGAMCLPKFFAVSEFMIAASENFVLRSLRYHKGIRCESGTVPQR